KTTTSKIPSITKRTIILFFFSSRRRHTRCLSDWSSDVCSSDLSGENATAVSRSEWPSSVCSGAPVAESQSLSVRSLDADATSLRSEERRVGKEWRSRWGREQDRDKSESMEDEGWRDAGAGGTGA